MKARLFELKKKAAKRNQRRDRLKAKQNRQRHKERLIHEAAVVKATRPFFNGQIEEAIEALLKSSESPAGPASALSAELLLPNPVQREQALKQTLWPRLLKTMILGMDGELRRLGLNMKRAVGKIKAPSTASRLLESLGDMAVVNDIVNTPHGPVNIGFITEYPQWMQDAAVEFLEESFAQDYWSKTMQTVYGDIEDYLKKGTVQGWSIADMAREMKGHFLEDGYYATLRGKTIARTEVGHALNGARSMAIDQVVAEMNGTVDLRKVWHSVLGTTTRDSHAHIDGVPADDDGFWYLSGYKCRWPSDVTLPARERVNCFPGFVNVSGSFEGAQRVWYEGIVTEIVTKTTRLTVTPQHPIETTKGWVGAGSLNQGDKVLCHRLHVDSLPPSAARKDISGVCASGGDDEYNKPVSIKQVFEALFACADAGFGGVEVRRAYVNDFYNDGDSCNGDIHIVRADWKLLLDAVTRRFNECGNPVFAFEDCQLLSVTGEGSFGFGGGRVGLAPSGLLSGLYPLSNSSLSVRNITPSGTLAIGIASDFNPCFNESSSETGPRQSILLGETLKRNAGRVFLDDVVEVRNFKFSGHVYDLQSEVGVIVASDPGYGNTGIVTSNCQCTIVTELGMGDDQAQGLIQAYEDRIAAGKAFLGSIKAMFAHLKPLAVIGGRKATTHMTALQILWDKASACGAGGGPGKPGFQPGNKCAAGAGGYTAPVLDEGTGLIKPGSVGSYSGVDTSAWDNSKTAAKHTLQTIAALEKAAHDGDWDYFNKKMSKAKKPTKWQKYVMKAQEALLDKKAKGLLHAAGTEEHQQAVNPDPKPPTPKPKLKATSDASHIWDGAGWKKVEGKSGTEKGGIYEAPNGDRFYVKLPDNPDRARNEVLVNKLYQLTGATTAQTELIMIDGKLGSASKMVDNPNKVDWSDEMERNRAANHFGAHVWLNNWDAIGAGSENPMANIISGDNENGTGIRQFIVDTGGGLDFKGAGGGGKKPFSPDSIETWDNMMNPSVNPTTAQVFKGAGGNHLMASAVRVAQVDEADVAALVKKYRPDDHEAITSTLETRRIGIALRGKNLKSETFEWDEMVQMAENHKQKYKNKALANAMAPDGKTVPKAPTAQAATKPPAVEKKQAEIKIDPGKFPKEPEFLSKNVEQVTQNKAIIAEAKKAALNKDTDGVAAAKAKAKSPKVQQYIDSLGANLIDQLNPPPPPKPLEGTAKELYDKMSKVPVNKNAPAVGYWNMLKVDEHLVDSYVPEGKFDEYQTPSFWEEGAAAIKKNNCYKAMRSYTGGGYNSINPAIRSGNLESNAYAKKWANALMKAPVLPDNLMLARKHQLNVGDIDSIKPGHVVSDRGALSTSTYKFGRMSGNVLWRMRVNKGVQGFAVENVSSTSGETEVVLPPNQRLMVTKVYRPKKGENAPDMDGGYQSFDAVIYAEVLPTVKDQCCPP